MLKNSMKLLTKTDYLLNRTTAPITGASPAEKWDLYAAVFMERKPVITPEMSELEQKFQNLIAELDMQESVKSDFEMNVETETAQLEQSKKGDDTDIVLLQTSQDLHDRHLEELNKFKFAPRVTQADRENNQKSLKRKLDKSLVLVMSQKVGPDNFYILPQGLRLDGETMRQTAERVLKQSCGEKIRAQFFSNAPCSFYKYKYPNDIRMEMKSIGAKIFIYFARHRSGAIDEESSDYKWLDKDELKAIMPNMFYRSISPILLD